MTIQMLKQFEALVNYQSFTLAANALHISQSALSHGIQNLETELQAVLFERQGNGIRLTPSGRDFFKYAHQILSEQENLMLKLNDQHDPFINPLRIIMRMALLPQARLVQEFKKEYPLAKIILYQHEQYFLTNYTWDLSFYFSTASIPFHSEPLAREHYVLVHHKNHPLSEQSLITPVLLNQYPAVTLQRIPAEIRQAMEQWFFSSNVIPHYDVVTDHYPLLEHLLYSRNYWAIIPDLSMVPPNSDSLCYREIPNLNIYRWIYLETNKNRYQTEIQRLFLRFAKRFFDDYAKEFQ